MEVNKNIDVLRYVMSLMIILIHVGYSYEFPILRVAVPIFFIISSYFFFKKVENLKIADAHTYYHKFFARTIKLYVFWLIVFFPILIFQNIHAHTLTKFFTHLPLNLLLCNTFSASWYLAALIIGISFVYKTLKYSTLTIAISFFAYALCCMDSNYANIFIPFVEQYIPTDNAEMHYIIMACFKSPVYNSFPAGLLFITIGRLLTKTEGGYKIALAGSIIGFVCLLTEYNFVKTNHLGRADDCYFSLILLAPSLLLFFKNLPMHITFDTQTLRKMSTIYYCSHLTIIKILTLQSLPIPYMHYKFMVFITTWLICTLIATTLIKLASKFRMLKYSY